MLANWCSVRGLKHFGLCKLNIPYLSHMTPFIISQLCMFYLIFSYLTHFISQRTVSFPHCFALTESATLVSLSCSSCFAIRFSFFIYFFYFTAPCLLSSIKLSLAFLSAVLPQAKSAFSLASQTNLKRDPPGAIWLSNKRLHLYSLCLALPVYLINTDYTPYLFGTTFLIGWNNDFRSG